VKKLEDVIEDLDRKSRLEKYTVFECHVECVRDEYALAIYMEGDIMHYVLRGLLFLRRFIFV
jgi:hypothetical protein